MTLIQNLNSKNRGKEEKATMARKRREVYASLACFEATAMPTNSPTTMSMSAIVVAAEVRLALAAAMNPSVARINMIAMAMTYPRIGLTVSIRDISLLNHS